MADLQERRAWVEQPFDPLARQQLAARRMALARHLAAAQRDLRCLGAQVIDDAAHVRRIGAKVLGTGVDLRLQYLHA